MTPAPHRRRLRWSLRTMLVVVTLVAITLAAGLALRARAQRLAERADWHEDEAARFEFSASLRQIGGLGLPGFEERDKARQRAERAIADEHKSLAAKCRRARWRPWILIEDPPHTREPANRIEPPLARRPPKRP